MVSLRTVGSRFSTTFTLLAGGSGIVRGELSETEQTTPPSYVFTNPRHILRTRFPSIVKPGMVLQSHAGEKFLVGDNGPSEQSSGTIWQSFRLFEITGLYRWERRLKVMDPIARQLKDTGKTQLMGMIWAAMEPLDRPQFDREIHYTFNQSRIITGAPIQNDDVIDNRVASKVDKQLGVSIGVVT